MRNRYRSFHIQVYIINKVHQTKISNKYYTTHFLIEPITFLHVQQKLRNLCKYHKISSTGTVWPTTYKRILDLILKPKERFLNASSHNSDSHMYFSSSSSSSSSDEEFIMTAIDALPRPRLPRDRVNPFDLHNDAEFVSMYRFSKSTVKFILEEISEHIEPNDARNMPVSAMNQLLLTLRFYATSSYQYDLADQINVCKSTVCRIINKVTNHIADLLPAYVRMPKNEIAVKEITEKFSRLCGFPQVIGCIDCMHIPIQFPRSDDVDPALYKNKQGSFSIIIQVVCDTDTKIMNIVAQPGSVEITELLDESGLHDRLQSIDSSATYLIGDNKYACSDHLLTPLLNPQTIEEVRYNNAHIMVRNKIHNTFVSMKRRFPCLVTPMRLKMQTAMKTILACAVLHNIAIDFGDNLLESHEISMVPQEAMKSDLSNGQNDDNVVRSMLINSVFANT